MLCEFRTRGFKLRSYWGWGSRESFLFLILREIKLAVIRFFRWSFMDFSFLTVQSNVNSHQFLSRSSSVIYLISNLCLLHKCTVYIIKHICYPYFAHSIFHPVLLIVVISRPTHNIHLWNRVATWLCGHVARRIIM